MMACTENRECIVLDNTSQSNSADGCVFWYKAVHNHGPFRVGSKVYWRFGQRMLTEDDEDDAGMQVDTRKKKLPKIRKTLG